MSPWDETVPSPGPQLDGRESLAEADESPAPAAGPTTVAMQPASGPPPPALSALDMPPDGTFLADRWRTVITPEERADLLKQQNFIDEQLAIADSYLPHRKLAEFRAAEEEYKGNPSPERLEKLDQLMHMGDPRAYEVAIKHKRLRTAALESTWRHYIAHSVPIIRTVMLRAHADVLAAIEELREREKIWKETWGIWDKWRRYCGSHQLNFPSALQHLGQRAIDMHKQIDSLPKGQINVLERVLGGAPRVDSLLTHLGISIKATSEAK